MVSTSTTQQNSGSGNDTDPEGTGYPSEHHLLQTRSGGPPDSMRRLTGFDPIILLEGLSDLQVLTWVTRPPIAAERRQSFPSRREGDDSDELLLSEATQPA